MVIFAEGVPKEVITNISNTPHAASKRKCHASVRMMIFAEGVPKEVITNMECNSKYRIL
jgi:hypothetical protein